mmetsp:Transcript_24841/g.41100  ORF Transcript_24841/g.41100 Transcript_24841/m.41100 type:complete len:101 (-) Transcript_24841:20-322(-)
MDDFMRVQFEGLTELERTQYREIGRSLMAEAQHRWLDPEEIREILLYGPRYGFSMATTENCTPQETPPSGTLRLAPAELAVLVRRDQGPWKRRAAPGGGG